MKQKILIIMLLVLTVGCGSFNEGQAELHINKNISTGQELLDLQEALDKDIISKEEFEAQKAVLARSREKINQLEIKMEQLKQQLDSDK